MKAYQLKIMIKDSHPPIWRRLMVPAGLTFSQLQLLFNEAMGWSGAHLASFEFRKDGIVIEELEEDEEYDMDFGIGILPQERTLNAVNVLIDDFLDDVNRFDYIYDFGDYWVHSVEVEKIDEDYPYDYAQVIKFKGETPFEDCGGIYGYGELLRVLDDPSDPEYEDMKEWTESHFTERPYPIEEVNAQFERLYLSEEESEPMGRDELYEAFWSGEPFKRIRVSSERQTTSAFREMRLKDDNQLPREQAEEMLKQADHGVLAVLGDGGYPYAVPLNFAFKDDKIYFHGAPVGHKFDAVMRYGKVSFCVVTKAEIVPDAYNCLYLSAIAFGKVHPASDVEKRRGLEAIVDKYSADFKKGGIKYINASWGEVCVFVMEIEHLTGKKGTP